MCLKPKTAKSLPLYLFLLIFPFGHECAVIMISYFYCSFYSFRQLRNRDAAVRSRERKKTYVRDLELKSKYYESECRRLGIMLQYCLAENQTLRLSLQNSKAVGASMPMQESAVLLLGKPIILACSFCSLFLLCL